MDLSKARYKNRIDGSQAKRAWAKSVRDFLLKASQDAEARQSQLVRLRYQLARLHCPPVTLDSPLLAVKYHQPRTIADLIALACQDPLAS